MYPFLENFNLFWKLWTILIPWSQYFKALGKISSAQAWNTSSNLKAALWVVFPLFLFRISVIFRVKSAKAVKITDMDLIKRLGLIVGAFVLCLLIRTLVSPPVVIVGKYKISWNLANYKKVLLPLVEHSVEEFIVLTLVTRFLLVLIQNGCLQSRIF